MYKFPKNYIDFIIDKFFEAFQGYNIYLVKSSTMIKEVSKAYINMVDKRLNWLNDSIKSLQAQTDRSKEAYDYYLYSVERNNKELNEAMTLLFNFDSIDAPRMKSIYSKRLKGYRRESVDRKKECSLLKRA